jgi:HK97 family phage prohead protease
MKRQSGISHLETRQFAPHEICRVFSVPTIETKSVEVALDHVFTEAKFSASGAEGVISGYGAVFGNRDSHDDMIVPGAFKDSLAERKAANRSVPMHLMHRVFGGDGVPVGVWTSVEEDDKGLRVEGKLSGMNTDKGRHLFELVKDGALGGLSIGYKVRTNGASYGKKAGEPKRTLKALSLQEISLVDDPSNALTRVNEIKAAIVAAQGEDGVGDPGVPDVPGAVERLAEAILMQDKVLSSSGAYYNSNAKDAALLMDALRDAYEELTGTRNPPGLEGWKNATIRDVEKALRDAGASRSLARAIAEHGYKAASQPREEGDTKADETKKAVDALEAYLASLK